ncbi:hypothetical protein [Mycobacterium sp. 1465703.0]|nr:hypothetical protein [Mycobacterium sp. 1465703.0]
MNIRAIELVRAGWGAVLLAAPAEVLDQYPRHARRPRSAWP